MTIPLSQYRPFMHDEEFNITVDSDSTPVPVQHLQVPSLTAGVYQVTLSIVFSSPDTNDFVRFIYTSDANSIGDTEFRKESKDTDDIVPFTYTFVVTHATDGPFDIKLESQLEAGGNDATIQVANIIVEKKGE